MRGGQAMKRSVGRWRLVGLMVIASSLICVARLVAAEADDFLSLSFDQPFEQTRVKNLLDAYMRLWSDLEFLSSKQGLSNKDEQAIAFESAIGRATFVGWAVDRLLRENAQHEAVGDGLHYMCHATAQMGDLASQITTEGDHARCMQELLARLWQRLSCGVATGRSFQGDNAAIGAS